MIHIVTKLMDMTDDSTMSRDITSVEDTVNTFIQNPNVTIIETEHKWFEIGFKGDTFLSVLINYNQRQR